MGDKVKNIAEFLKTAQEFDNLEKDISEAKVTLANLNKDINLVKKEKQEIVDNLNKDKVKYSLEYNRLNKIVSDLETKQRGLSNQNNVELNNIQNKINSLQTLEGEAKKQNDNIIARENNISKQQKEIDRKNKILEQITILVEQL